MTYPDNWLAFLAGCWLVAFVGYWGLVFAMGLFESLKRPRK